MGALVDGLSPERRSDLTFIEDTKIILRDSTTYIQSSTAGTLDLIGSTSITGNTEITGETSITGNINITGEPTINLPTTDTTSMLTVKDSETFPVFKVDGKGNIKAKGGVQKI